MMGRAIRKSTQPHNHAIPWYWRLLAFASSWLLLAGFLALPPLYDSRPGLRLSTVTLSVLAITALTTGFALSPLLFSAVPDWSFHVNSVYTPCLSSTSLGLVTLLLSFEISDSYKWSTSAILGIVAASVSSIVYGMLVVQSYRTHELQHTLQADDGFEYEATLLNPTTVPSRSRSLLSEGRSVTPVKRPQSVGGDHNYFNAVLRSASMHDNERPSATTSYPTASTWLSYNATTPSEDPFSDSGTNAYIPNSSTSLTRESSPRPRSLSAPRSYVLRAAAPGEVPVQTVPANMPNPEEELTRQQMLGLLLAQTSKQARQNPETQTFKIELPRGVRKALRETTFDMLDSRETGTFKTTTTFAATEVGEDNKQQTLMPPLRPRPAYSPERPHSRGREHSRPSSGGAPTVDRSLRATTGHSSVQQTPASAYRPNGAGWKTREDRRREIERGR